VLPASMLFADNQRRTGDGVSDRSFRTADRSGNSMRSKKQ
jgi:hypothetical protein